MKEFSLCKVLGSKTADVQNKNFLTLPYGFVVGGMFRFQCLEKTSLIQLISIRESPKNPPAPILCNLNKILYPQLSAIRSPLTL